MLLVLGSWLRIWEGAPKIEPEAPELGSWLGRAGGLLGSVGGLLGSVRGLLGSVGFRWNYYGSWGGSLELPLDCLGG